MEASDFFVEDLLDLPTGDDIIPDAFFHPSISTDSSSSPSAGPADAHFSPAPHFSGELCVPYDDVAELEWLSNFVEDSFSSHVSNGAPGPNPTPIQIQQSSLRPDGPVPGKARSKLSRVAPSDWTTRLPVGPAVGPNPNKKTAKKRVDYSSERANYGEVRRCLHCASEKTPQWRTGPMGPKTLCNACGVRYKSGRLVAEYRPAASPSFVATKHSNSHRKVVELRRQNENQRHHQQFVGAGGPAGGVYVGGGDDNYLIRHHVGPDFRQLI